MHPANCEAPAAPVRRRRGSLAAANDFADEVAEAVLRGETVSESIDEQQPKPQPRRMWLPTPMAELLHHLVLLASLVNVLAFPMIRAFYGPVTLSNFAFWYVCLWTLDAVLWLDLCCTFVTPIWDDHGCVPAGYPFGRLLFDLVARLPWDVVFPGVDGRLAFDYGHLARLLLVPNAVAVINDPVSTRATPNELIQQAKPFKEANPRQLRRHPAVTPAHPRAHPHGAAAWPAQAGRRPDVRRS